MPLPGLEAINPAVPGGGVVVDGVRALREAAAGSIALADAVEGRLSGSAGDVWLHAVDDGSGGLVVSWARRDAGAVEIRVGRVDPSGGLDPWSEWPVSDETVVVPGGTYDVRDTWHVFAHGYHWITFSVGGGEELYLLVLDTTLAVFLAPVEIVGSVAAGTAPAQLETGYYNTNDHFLVPRVGGGIDIAVRYTPDKEHHGHYVVRVDTAGNVVGEFEFVSPANNHANLASGDRVPATWPGTDGSVQAERQVLAPSIVEYNNALAVNELQLVRAGNKWGTGARHGVHEVLERWALQVGGVDTMLAMATQVRFENGWRLVTFRYIVDPATVPAPGGDDHGYVGRWLFDDTRASQPTGSLDADLETLSAAPDCNRPHTVRLGDELVTCWDASDSTCWLRVERITY